jgi:hypothetical protein
MALIDFSRLVETASGLSSASNKLLLVAGESGSAKSLLIRRIAAELGWPTVNVGQTVSKSLLSLTNRQRRLKAEEIVAEALDTPRLCLDNTEILFDPILALNPVSLLLILSRKRVLIATWNGHLENGSLVYAYPEHPEYFKEAASGFPVVTLKDEKMHLFLQP